LFNGGLASEAVLGSSEKLTAEIREQSAKKGSEGAGRSNFLVNSKNRVRIFHGGERLPG
jgi:hypothetical protein